MIDSGGYSVGEKYRVVPLWILEDIQLELSLQKKPLTPDSTSTKMYVDAIIEKRGLFDNPAGGPHE